jgi:hypothetical protein
MTQEPKVVVQMARSEDAPVIYSDGCLAWKNVPGMCEFELGVHMTVPVRINGQDTVRDKWVCVAHLRMTPVVTERFVAVINDALDNLKIAQNGAAQKTVVPEKTVN